jgi:hypothetical protein
MHITGICNSYGKLSDAKTIGKATPLEGFDLHTLEVKRKALPSAGQHRAHEKMLAIRPKGLRYDREQIFPSAAEELITPAPTTPRLATSCPVDIFLGSDFSCRCTLKEAVGR